MEIKAFYFLKTHNFLTLESANSLSQKDSFSKWTNQSLFRKHSYISQKSF